MKSRVRVSSESHTDEGDQTEDEKRNDYAHSNAGCVAGMLDGLGILRSLEDVQQGVCGYGRHLCQSMIICSCVRGCC